MHASAPALNDASYRRPLQTTTQLFSCRYSVSVGSAEGNAAAENFHASQPALGLRCKDFCLTALHCTKKTGRGISVRNTRVSRIPCRFSGETLPCLFVHIHLHQIHLFRWGSCMCTVTHYLTAFNSSLSLERMTRTDWDSTGEAPSYHLSPVTEYGSESGSVVYRETMVSGLCLDITWSMQYDRIINP